MATLPPPSPGRTVVILRCRSRDGYDDVYDAYEVICAGCWDDPCMDYGEVSPRLQQVRGPYWLEHAVVVSEAHLRRHGQTSARGVFRPGRRS